MNLPAVTNALRAQLPVPYDLAAAMEPYRRATPLAASLDEVDIDELHWITHTNRVGDLWTTYDSDGDPRKLWQYRDQAASLLNCLPGLSEVQAARDIVLSDIETEPPLQARVGAICTMLDIQNIAASGSYVKVLAGKLGRCPRRATENNERPHPWIPMAAICATIDELVTNVSAGGRPIDIAELLDLAGRHSSELIRLNTALETIVGVIPTLCRIMAAVKDVPRPPPRKPPDWADDYPIPF